MGEYFSLRENRSVLTLEATEIEEIPLALYQKIISILKNGLAYRT
jgi:hypothetical protein